MANEPKRNSDQKHPEGPSNEPVSGPANVARGLSSQAPRRTVKVRRRSIVPKLELPSVETALENEDELAAPTITERIHRNRNPLSSVLISMIAHTVMLVLLALFVFRGEPDTYSHDLVVELDDLSAPVMPATEIEKIEIVAEPELTPSPLELEAEDTSTESEELAPESDSTLAQVESLQTNPNEAKTDEVVAPNQNLPTGGGLEGREKASRARLAAARGGSKASEEAVERGLRWIVDHQLENGSWRLIHNGGNCNGRCRDPGTQESTTAATGLCLMALLGAGYTHETGPYQAEIKKGLDYLVSRIRPSVHGGNLAEGTMYAQGIATIALAEAYNMTKDQAYYEPTKLAVQYIVSAQHSRGGWRYNPGMPGDMTVSGWQIMALKSARMAGFETPPEVFGLARQFIESLGESNGTYYGYLKKGKEATPTAIGLVSQMYLGWPRTRGELDVGAEWLTEIGPSKNNVYFNYYTTQLLHHTNSKYWDEWNLELRDFLVKKQSKRGHESGSWHFVEKHGSAGGRLYSTAMCVMILEVYYRYMPLYDENAIGSNVELKLEPR